jgi:hypothetical protein
MKLFILIVTSSLAMLATAQTAKPSLAPDLIVVNALIRNCFLGAALY